MRDDISEEVRKYWESAKKERDELTIQPGEFTTRMFCTTIGITWQSADAELAKRVNRGELTVRNGKDSNGKACKLYRIIQKFAV